MAAAVAIGIAKLVLWVRGVKNFGAVQPSHFQEGLKAPQELTCFVKWRIPCHNVASSFVEVLSIKKAKKGTHEETEHLGQLFESERDHLCAVAYRMLILPSPMNYSIKILVIKLFIIGFSTCGLAQNVSNSSGQLESKQWVIGAYVGGAHTHPAALKLSQPALGNDLTFEGVRFRSRSFERPLYYGFRAGYFMRRLPSVGFEAEFIHLKVFADPQQRVRVRGLRHSSPIDREVQLEEIVQQYSISHGVNLLLFNVVGRHVVKQGVDRHDHRLILNGRVGLGPTFPHTESRIDSMQHEQYELGRLALQVAGGAEIKLWRGLYAFGEYKFSRTHQQGKVFNGNVKSLLRSQHGVFGLSYHF